MKLYLSTPILRTIVRKLNSLDNKVAETIVKLDKFINDSSRLRKLFGSDINEPLRQIQPFLREDLIKKTIQECVAREQRRRSLPSPGNSLKEQQEAATLTQSELNDLDTKIARLIDTKPLPLPSSVLRQKLVVSPTANVYLHVGKGLEESDGKTQSVTEQTVQKDPSISVDVQGVKENQS